MRIKENPLNDRRALSVFEAVVIKLLVLAFFLNINRSNSPGYAPLFL